MSLIDQDGYAATLYRELDHREPFATIEFDFVLMPAVEGVVGTIVDRERAQAA